MVMDLGAGSKSRLLYRVKRRLSPMVPSLARFFDNVIHIGCERTGS